MISSFLISVIFATVATCLPQPVPQASNTTSPISTSPSAIPSDAESTTLYPAVHWQQDTKDLSILSPSNKNRLYYTNFGGQADPAVQHIYSDINSTFAYSTVVLQHSAYIQDVHCVSDGLEIFFSNSKAFQAAQASWSTVKNVVMVATNTTDCSSPNPGQHTYWLATGLTFVTSDLTVHVASHELPMNKLFQDVDMNWGTYVPPSIQPSNETIPVSQTCGLPQNATIDDLPAAACGADFDQILDDAAGYINDNADLLRTFAPGLVLNQRRSAGTLVKRFSLGSIVSSIGNAVSSAAKTVSNAVTNVVNQGVAAVQQATVVDVPPINFDIPINIGPKSVDKSPFPGQSLLLLHQDQTSNGVKASLDVFCVDCGVSGTLHVAGHVSFSVLPVPILKSGSVDMNGNIKASLSLGIDASVQFDKNITKNIATAGVPGISIPNIIAVGPSISLDSEFEVNLAANGRIQAGASLSIPNFSSTLDFLDGSKSHTSGFTPELTPIFFAQGSFTGSTSYSLPVTIGVGIVIPPISFDKRLSLINKPTAKAVVAVDAQIGSVPKSLDTSKCKNGVTFQVDITNDISVDLFGAQTFSLAHFELPVVAPRCKIFSRKRSFGQRAPAAGFLLPSGAVQEPPCTSSPVPATSSTPAPTVSSLPSTVLLAAQGTPSPVPVATDNSRSTIMDVTGNYSLSLSPSGSFIAVPKSQSLNFTTIMSGAVAIGDASGNPFFYYTSTMSRLGVSRFRSADTQHLPLSSRMVTLTALEIQTSPENSDAAGKGVFMGLDSENNWFWPVVCRYAEDQGLESKVFFVKDVGEGIKVLVSNNDEIRWTVTGGVIDFCEYRPFVASGKGL